MRTGLPRASNAARNASNRAATFSSLFWLPPAWPLRLYGASRPLVMQGHASPWRSPAGWRSACWPFPSPSNKAAALHRDPSTGKRAQFASSPAPDAAPPGGHGNAHRDPARESNAARACRNKFPWKRPSWPKPMPKAEWPSLPGRKTLPAIWTRRESGGAQGFLVLRSSSSIDSLPAPREANSPAACVLPPAAWRRTGKDAPAYSRIAPGRGACRGRASAASDGLPPG